ncbi:hypothetical protein ACLF3G_15355 [Falsiroseomonas sp. HC035]|uniref:hypothetical protein n=1 Tax=Falsiroseomonas sp. HC035 TaxID=3390999 RepID=UPI003D323F22
MQRRQAADAQEGQADHVARHENLDRVGIEATQVDQEAVIADAADQQVVTPAAIQRIVAAQVPKNIIAIEPGQRICAVRAKKRGSRGAPGTWAAIARPIHMKIPQYTTGLDQVVSSHRCQQGRRRRTRPGRRGRQVPRVRSRQ